MSATPVTEAVPLHVPRLIVAWSVALVMSIAVIFFTATADRFEWLVIILGVSVIVSFALQLGTARREGFITRLSFSVVGSLLVIALVELCAFLLGSR